MNDGDPKPKRASEEKGRSAEPSDDSLEAASSDATREIEKREEAGGHGGFGDIG